MKKINHKGLWFDSMTGMTIGFIATLIVGTVIGIFGLYSDDNIFISIKKGMTFITPFGIGIGIGVKHKLNPLQIFAVGLSSFIVGRSLMVPQFINGTFDLTNVKVDIDMRFLPGDVFAAWLAGVIMLYVFELYKIKTSVDIFLLPIIGILIGVVDALWLTYLTTLITISLEWIINNTINHKLWLGLLLAPIFGLVMGLALSLPTSSAAMAFALGLHGDAAIVAIAATAAQMISFGTMTYLSTKDLPKSLAVGLGTSMLQINNYVKKPTLLIIPAIASMVTAVLALATFHGLLEFKAKSTTTGMGTAVLYGQIFSLKENGWTNGTAWLNVTLIQLAFPLLLTTPLTLFTLKKGLIKKQDLAF